MKQDEQGKVQPRAGYAQEKAQNPRYKFLNALMETGSIRQAALVSGKPRQHWVKLRERDARFSAAWDQALESYVEVLEAEADRRALNGEEEAIFYGGKQIGSRCKTSDSLLMFRLKALRPSRYKDSPQDGGAVRVEVKSFLDMTVSEKNETDTDGGHA